MKKSRFCLLLLLFFSFKLNCQVPEFKYIIVNKDSLYYLDRPITNKEYITFLLHNSMIFGESFNNYVYSLFPHVEKKLSYFYESSSIDTPFIFKFYSNSSNLVRNYIFNPKYSNYPVIGISEYQASQFAKWYTDRLNEYQLISNKIIRLNFPSEVDDNHFSTESFICGQYEPLWHQDYAYDTSSLTKNMVDHYFKLYNKYFYNNLRLPTSYELSKLKSQKNLLKEYLIPNNFLNFWADSFIELSNEKKTMIIKYNGYSKAISSSKYIPLFEKVELQYGKSKDSSIYKVLIDELQAPEILPIYFIMESKEKNNYGYCDFNFMFKNENNNIIINKYSPDKWDNTPTYKPFRLVFNKKAITNLAKFDDTYKYEMPK